MTRCPFVRVFGVPFVAALGSAAVTARALPAESNPAISPDGRTLAFTARYEGPAQVYTMPVSGGMPVRHTWEPENSIVTSWTPDGKLVYTTTRYSGIPKLQLVQLDVATHERTSVPMAGASEGTWEPSGRTMYFARPGFHNNVTKLYRGGTARDVWKHSAGAAEAVELTTGYEGESHSPLYWNGRVYFVTDRDSTMNVWSMDTTGRDLRQHTRHTACSWPPSRTGGWCARRARIACAIGTRFLPTAAACWPSATNPASTK